MVFLNLKQQVFKELNMVMTVEKNTEMQIDSRFSFNVQYADKNEFCVATLRQELVYRDDPNKFHIIVESIGNFACEGISSENDKKQAHIQAYTLLFPYVQNMVGQLAISAGLPRLMIEMVKMKAEDVNIQH